MESEPKKQKRTRRTFTDEFRAGAVSLVLEKGKTMAQVARDLDLTQSTLGRWVEQARANAGKSTRGTLTTEEKTSWRDCGRRTASCASSEKS